MQVNFRRRSGEVIVERTVVSDVPRNGRIGCLSVHEFRARLLVSGLQSNNNNTNKPKYAQQQRG